MQTKKETKTKMEIEHRWNVVDERGELLSVVHGKRGALSNCFTSKTFDEDKEIKLPGKQHLRPFTWVWNSLTEPNEHKRADEPLSTEELMSIDDLIARPGTVFYDAGRVPQLWLDEVFSNKYKFPIYLTDPELSDKYREILDRHDAGTYYHSSSIYQLLLPPRETVVNRCLSSLVRVELKILLSKKLHNPDLRDHVYSFLFHPRSTLHDLKTPPKSLDHEFIEEVIKTNPLEETEEQLARITSMVYKYMNVCALKKGDTIVYLDWWRSGELKYREGHLFWTGTKVIGFNHEGEYKTMPKGYFINDFDTTEYFQEILERSGSLVYFRSLEYTPEICEVAPEYYLVTLHPLNKTHSKWFVLTNDKDFEFDDDELYKTLDIFDHVDSVLELGFNQPLDYCNLEESYKKINKRFDRIVQKHGIVRTRLLISDDSSE